MTYFNDISKETIYNRLEKVLIVYRKENLSVCILRDEEDKEGESLIQIVFERGSISFNTLLMLNLAAYNPNILAKKDGTIAVTFFTQTPK